MAFLFIEASHYSEKRNDLRGGPVAFAKTLGVVWIVFVLAAASADHARAQLRVKNSTDRAIEVNVTYIQWGHDFFVNETGWKELKPQEYYDPDKSYFGLGKIYFLTARYAGESRRGSALPISSWHSYEAGKYSIATSSACFDPKGTEFRQLNNEPVLEDIKKGDWSSLKQHWPAIRRIEPVAKIMPLSDTYGSFQIDLHPKRCVTTISKQ